MAHLFRNISFKLTLFSYFFFILHHITTDGIGEPVVKLHWDRPSSLHTTVIDLTETVAPDDRVVTGLKFAISKKGHVYLEVTSTEINLREGFLYSNTTRPEEHEDGL